jgi:hypothetical protein
VRHPRQNQLFRAIYGAVKNTADAHPGWQVDVNKIARSVAKRAAGTISAQWGPGLLAAHSMPSDSAEPPTLVLGGAQPRTAALRTPCGTGRGASGPIRGRPSLLMVWKRLAYMAGQAKRAGNQERLAAVQDALRLVASFQQERVR